jgi:hypothetical protein
MTAVRRPHQETEPRRFSSAAVGLSRLRHSAGLSRATSLRVGA